jgi:outer membrane immunogenic protein
MGFAFGLCKRLPVTLIAVATICTLSANAADMPVKAAKAPVVLPPQAYNWSGGYLGVHLGGSWHRVRWTDEADDWFDNSKRFSSNGIAGGAAAGWNFQSGPIVYGVEIDGTWTDNKSVTRPTDFDGIVTNKVNWIATLRGRVGYAADRVMVFATAGGARADIGASMSSNDFPTETFGEIVGTKNGWVWGGGIDYAAWDNVVISGQVLFHRFGSERAKQLSQPDETMLVDRQSVITARLGISVKFNSGTN